MAVPKITAAKGHGSQLRSKNTITSAAKENSIRLKDMTIVGSIPTLMVFKNGALVNTAVGAMPKAEILKLV